jgi:hypothetical protein
MVTTVILACWTTGLVGFPRVEGWGVTHGGAAAAATVVAQRQLPAGRTRQPPAPPSPPPVKVAPITPVIANVKVTIKAAPGSTGFGAVDVKSATGKTLPKAHLFPIDALNARTVEGLPGDTLRLEASTYDPDQQFAEWSGPCAAAGKNPVCLYTIPGTPGATTTVSVRFAKVLKTVLVTIKAAPGSTGFGAVQAKSTTGKTLPNHYLFPVDVLNSQTVQAYPGDTVRLEASTYDPDQQFVEWSGPCAAAGKNPVCLYTIPGTPGATMTVSVRFAKVPKTVLVTIKAAPGSTGFGAVQAKSTTGKTLPNHYLFPVDVLNSQTVQAYPGDTIRLEAKSYGGGSFVQWGAGCSSYGASPVCLYQVPPLGATPQVEVRFDK